MRCEEVRESISARLDDETPPLDDDTITRHLVGCPACRSFKIRAEDLHRRLRIREATDAPDLTEAILDRHEPPQ